jgi:hypothetical protein
MLSYNIKYRKSSFIPIITNYSRSLSPSGVQLDKLVDFNTKEGYNMNLPTNTTASNTGSTFQLDLPETQNLDITKMMSLWVKYMENIGNGTFNPNPDMVRLRKLDFMSSLFYFVFEPDGRTLKYWVKFTGCFPTEIPSSSLGY